jgi:hypothetical protein
MISKVVIGVRYRDGEHRSGAIAARVSADEAEPFQRKRVAATRSKRVIEKPRYPALV